jgi:uncharacterized protein
MKQQTRDEHLFGSGPKRILSLDGGGVRGILCLQVLRRIEDIIRKRVENGDRLCLADYFDLIGGTSTGAIIAAGLSLGWSVDQIEKLYFELGPHIFKPSLFRPGLFQPKFDAQRLRQILEREFGNISLGGPQLRTGLAIVAKRLDTGSPWVIHNNPRGRYFDRRPGSSAFPNKDYLLSNIVRASTAAPHFFEPELIQVADNTEGAFVDGGVSPHNNPALQLLLLATLEGHALHWPLGADNLLIVSVGTGSKAIKLKPSDVIGKPAAELALRSLQSLMDDASTLNEQLLQWLSRSPTARSIDREVGNLSNDVLGSGAPWLTYLRYDVQLEREWLERNLALSFNDDDIDLLQQMDRPSNMDDLVRIGKAAAERLLEERHFDRVFDIV